IESAFPNELGGLFKNLEGKGNPWGMGARARLDWAKDLPFAVNVLGQDVEKASDVDYLFWVGCAGAYEDRAKKTTRAVAELLDTAGVSFAVLGDGESCTGDPDRGDLRALLQHDQERVPPGRWQLRGGPPHPAAQPPRPREEARAGRASQPRRHHGRRLDRGIGDLPRPLLPRPAQRRLRPAARADRRAAGGRPAGDGSLRPEVVLLRRRRCPHV